MLKFFIFFIANVGIINAWISLRVNIRANRKISFLSVSPEGSQAKTSEENSSQKKSLKSMLLKRREKESFSTESSGPDEDSAEVTSAKIGRKTVHLDLEDLYEEGCQLVDTITVSSDEDLFTEQQKSVQTENLQEIEELIELRFQARYLKDYDKADEIRERLRQEHDVEIIDYKKVWKDKNGNVRPLRTTPAGKKSTSSAFQTQVTPCTLPKEEIQRLVLERTVLRRSHKFKEADKIRDFLTKRGVELLDPMDLWCTFDKSLSGPQSVDRREQRDSDEGF